MTGRDGRTLEPSADHLLQRIPLVVRVHGRNLPRWGGVRADSARDHVHGMRPLRATIVRRPGGSKGRRDEVGQRRVGVIHDRGRLRRLPRKRTSPVYISRIPFRLACPFLPTMMWACTQMPSGRAMSMIAFVIWISACDGVGSPEGWLCTSRIAVADNSRARLITSRGSTGVWSTVA